MKPPSFKCKDCGVNKDKSGENSNRCLPCWSKFQVKVGMGAYKIETLVRQLRSCKKSKDMLYKAILRIEELTETERGENGKSDGIPARSINHG